MEEICEKSLCTGCSACANRCPTHSIIMVADKYGFLRPYINVNVCTNCGLCRKICPVNIPILENGEISESFAAQNKDDVIRRKSSSGGIFSVLACYILEHGGCVIGVEFDKRLNAVHKVVEDEEGLEKLRCSKYVQSSIGDIYIETKSKLEDGRLVLFTGTPCQIAGLMSFLGKEYDNLYTQDLICHGVASPEAWRRYIFFREAEKKSKVREATFRCKDSGWQRSSLKLDFESGDIYKESLITDFYLRSFIMNMTLRESCEVCHFKQKHRKSDLTLADFWGVEQYLPEWSDDEGTSLVIVHSKKGKQLVEAVKNNIRLEKVDFNDAIKHNPAMCKSVDKNLLRNRFLNDMLLMDYGKVYAKYCGTDFNARLRRKIAKIMGRFLQK